MNEFTLLDFSGNAENDEQSHNKRPSQPENLDQLQVLKAPDHIVQNVLNYSKALSVRKSDTLDHIKNVLN